MPLPTPILDDRSYQQLRDELVRRIPVYTREWTDHNPADPGITLIELFAFLGENLLFRFNQIPEATRLAFLRLLGIPLRPAQAARGLLRVTTDHPAGVLLAAGSPASAGAVPFETLTEVKVWPLSCVAVAKANAPAPEPGTEVHDFAVAAADAAELRDADETPAWYRPRTVPEDPMRPGAAPVDFHDTADGMLWVAVLAEPDVTDPAALAGGVLNLGVALDEDVLSLDDGEKCPGAGGGGTQGPDTLWEVSTGRLDAEGQPLFQRLDVEGDTTRGLTRTGVVRLGLPADATAVGDFDTVGDPDLRGTRGLPPELEDEEQAARVLFWVRAFRRNPSDRPLPRVVWLDANATEVVQSRKARPQFLGVGTGQPYQEFRLAHRPVMEGSLVVEVEEAGLFKPWEAVPGFEASSESDRHLVVDLEAGVVKTGSGLAGRVPQIGERVRALEYRYGGGPEGNVPAKALSRLDDHPSLRAYNPLPPRGGAPAETVLQALERVPAEIRRKDRAVTSSDFRELAHLPDVGRAEVLPLFHPPSRSSDAAGVVSVVVWPRVDRKRPGAPMPDRTLLQQVCAFLDERRLVTTELWVIPPSYRRIAVSVGVEVKPGYGIEAVRHWVELVVRQYLAPLPPYGPEGAGWPLGRAVLSRELEAAVLQVEGVRFLGGDVGLAEWDPAAGAWGPRAEVALSPWEVVELASVTVVEGAPLEPGAQLGPPAADKVPVPIPTLKEEC